MIVYKIELIETTETNYTGHASLTCIHKHEMSLINVKNRKSYLAEHFYLSLYTGLYYMMTGWSYTLF